MTSTDRVSPELRKLSEWAAPGLNFTRDDLERALLRPCYESGSPNVPAWNGYTNPVTELIFALIYDLRARIAAEDAAPMPPRQFAPGDPLIIRATATDVTAAMLNLGRRTEASFGPEDVVAAATSAAEVRAAAINVIDKAQQSWGQNSGRIADAILAHPILGPRLLGQQGGDAGEAAASRNAEACRYAESLAIALAKRVGAAPHWRPLSDDILGLLTQIDNATTGLRDPEPAVQAERDQAVAEVEKLRADKERLDFLDGCNRRLNATYGTTYKWKLILNHNVNRLMLHGLTVDLQDAEPNGLASCREAIDAEIKRTAAARAAIATASQPEPTS